MGISVSEELVISIHCEDRTCRQRFFQNIGTQLPNFLTSHFIGPKFCYTFHFRCLTLRLLMSYIYMERIFLMFLDHTQRCTTVGRTPLDEWSACRRTSTWQHTTLTTDKYPCPRWNSNPRSQEVSGHRPSFSSYYYKKQHIEFSFTL